MGAVENTGNVQAMYRPSRSRRIWLQYALGFGLAAGSSQHSFASQLTVGQPLDPKQSRAFRAWFSAIVEDQVQRPSPRWVHRDCAGLVRFAARQALQNHDTKWLQSMGWPSTQGLPPDVDVSAEQQKYLSRWSLQDGSRSDYASAISLVQNNTRRLGADSTQVQSADLLFYDQGAEQHLMVWTGRRIAYHTGAPETPEDNGLRSTTLSSLSQHPDTRWRPIRSNPNFAGWYRFTFLTP
jgi:uncharacterized protein